jgi:spore coat polysaccharide biosynthesis protein SpsF
MGSTRLPGKVLELLAGAPMIQRVVERVRRVTCIDEVVVATTVLEEERPLVDVCRSLGVHVVRGSPDDVLSRYVLAATEASADVVVRITSDCPLISPMVTARVVEAFRAGGCDYASNCHRRTFPRGLDVEVFSRTALDSSHAAATAAAEREHVTPFIYRHPERFVLRDVTDPVDRSHLRWTVDTVDDLALIQRMYSELGPDGHDYADALQVQAQHPEWSELNRHVEQKKV